MVVFCTVEPQCNKLLRDWQNLFTIMRFCYIKVPFHMFYYNWGKESHSLQRGLCFIEVCCIEVPLWQVFKYRECILSPLSFFMDFFLCLFPV